MIATMELKDQIFKTKPYAHQLEALRLSRDQESYALLMEMGTGKTKVGIDTVAYLFGKGKINGLVVVAPKSICSNWAKKEINAHLPDHIERRVVLWRASNAQFEKELKQLSQVEPLKLHVLVINIEALTSARGYFACESFLRGHQAMMVIDESTTIKNPGAHRTKKVIKLGLLADYRRIMTGTPVTQSPLDIFAQFEFLEKGSLGSSSFYGFRNQYAVLRKRYVNGRSFDEVTGYQRLDELQAILKSMSYRALKRDCLDLPEKIYEVRYIEPTEEQMRYYYQLRDEALAFLSDGNVVVAPLVITQLLRMRQALCNIAPNEAGSISWIDNKNPRLEETLSILEECGDQKVLIWANFVPSIKLLQEQIAEIYGAESVGCIYGDVNAMDRQTFVEKFQDPDSKLRFMVMQPRTGGYGLTLTEASLVVYYDNDWSLEVRQQSEDRAHRIGQKRSVTYIDLVAAGTVDEKIRQALIEKRDLADKVTGDKLRELLR